jgi:hypothetical protein
MTACIKKPEKFRIKNLMGHLKLLEKQEKVKPKSSRWQKNKD